VALSACAANLCVGLHLEGRLALRMESARADVDSRGRAKRGQHAVKLLLRGTVERIGGRAGSLFTVGAGGDVHFRFAKAERDKVSRINRNTNRRIRYPFKRGRRFQTDIFRSSPVVPTYNSVVVCCQELASFALRPASGEVISIRQVGGERAAPK